MKGIGILINDEYDLQMNSQRDANGQLYGFETGNTIPQNSAIILIHAPGQIKEMPLLGVGVHDMLMDHDVLGWRRKIRLALEMDGQDVNSIAFNEYKIEINGEYIN